MRLSNDGNTWSSPQAYTGAGSTAQAIAWDLTNPTYGGTIADGIEDRLRRSSRTPAASGRPGDRHDRARPPGGTSPYSNAVLADGPAGVLAPRRDLRHDGGRRDRRRQRHLHQRPDAQPGQPARRPTRPTRRSPSTAATITSACRPPTRSARRAKSPLEAWIKPTSLPASGSFASILTKAESYSLQFNGPRLEFTIIQSGTRRRLQAPSGAIVAGQTYHVVGTYDGTTQRLYVNGTQVASAALSGAITTNTNPLTIGSWNGSESSSTARSTSPRSTRPRSAPRGSARTTRRGPAERRPAKRSKTRAT